MSNEKRKKASRVQGGWAAPSITNVRSDRDKPKMPIGPAWFGKNIDNPTINEKHVYEKPADEEIVQKPPDIIIKKQGIHDLSLEPSGVSRIRYFPHFLDESESGTLFTELFHECPWHQRSDLKNGVSYIQPRLTAWFGDLPYSYSGQKLDPNTKWLPCLVTLKDHLEEVTGLKFNSLLANLYRDNHDSVDWHSDDEPELRKNPTIASLSFGDSRNFELRKKPPPEHANDFTNRQLVRLTLDAGSLLIMEGSVQDDWQHRVPKEYHDRGPRINLTFRVIYPDS
ncbi:alpha-ketoglutarate-dependent dioxygenase alkB homolog 3-like [Gigantopelta aegis]|uniref:alpha-ketoglutarate-dependent dioxygenase alkB homolog 3-like n=1 Tax=Gigantopelta aegis TaxID=1735272 RepID=UPI001B88932E|nr:alpha-ketoglutarate-dependent dioxygenase alkB homolog 3-like [Gigantopelta aegis]